MRFKWLNKNNNKNLIIFFNGWGFDEKVVSNLKFDCFDVLIFYDYRSFEQFNINLSTYEKKYLIAWSLGVYVCNYYYSKFKDFNGFTAINGTTKPIDDNYGIPVNAYNLTVDNFNEFTCKKFIKKIGANIEIIRSIQDLKNELISIKNLEINQFFNFNKIIISSKDKIFPVKNMQEFWRKTQKNISEIDAPHYIFNLYSKWSDLI